MLAILGGVSWGISGVCSQYLFTQYDLSADWLTAIRMLLSGILLLVLAFRKEHTRIFKIWTKGKDTFWLIAFALAGLLLCQYTFLAAIKHSEFCYSYGPSESERCFDGDRDGGLE